MEKIKITENDKIHETWYKEARKIKTIEEFSAFYKKLMEDYSHDYGTIIHALTALSIAATWLGNHHPNGGITGFQASCLMWEFITRWMGFKGPLKLVNYENMLYPQYGDRFEKTISKETWEYIQKEAQKNIDEYEGKGERFFPNINVWNHWHSIINGIVPFGYKVIDEK